MSTAIPTAKPPRPRQSEYVRANGDMSTLFNRLIEAHPRTAPLHDPLLVAEKRALAALIDELMPRRDIAARTQDLDTLSVVTRQMETARARIRAIDAALVAAERATDSTLEAQELAGGRPWTHERVFVPATAGRDVTIDAVSDYLVDE